MSKAEILQQIINERHQLKQQRDKLTEGLDPENIGGNPMQLMTKVPSLIEAYKLTAKIEELSDQFISVAAGV